jgi:hypothetical protein
MQIAIIQKLKQMSSAHLKTKSSQVVDRKNGKRMTSKIQKLTPDEYYAVAGGPQLENEPD